jgi:hypothetical protein
MKCECCGFERLSKPNPKIVLGDRPFNLFKDYVASDIEELRSLNYEDRVNYLEARSELVFLESIDEIYRQAKSEYLVKFHEMNIITILCCGIEALGHYLTGKGKGSAEESFKRFVEKFMPNWKPVLEELWDDFRNGLSHGSYIKHGGIEKGLGKPFESDAAKGIKLDFDIFVSDFKEAFANFFKRLGSDKKAFEKNFTKRFEEVLIS